MTAPTGAPAARPQTCFTAEHDDLLLALLRTPTATPMETARPAAIAAAQRLLAARAAASGFVVHSHEPAPPSALHAACVPVAVRAMAQRMGDEFLACQPNLVLRLGPEREPARTLVFNVHVDTVAGEPPVTADAQRFGGRGAVDMKGPAVALLAGLERAVAQLPGLADRLTILVHCVAGEEGGAMGVYGTRALVERGLVGRLNVFAEPTGGRWIDACRATMTACVDVAGEGATDDYPDSGHNATLLLGHVATRLAELLEQPVGERGATLCIAGLHTGTTHDRVYGAGRLLLNLAYRSSADAVALERAVRDAFDAALAEFGERFATIGIARRTARDAGRICTLSWLKRGLPALSNRDAAMERLLSGARFERLPADEAFTCDAIWAQAPGSYTIVLGPGSLRDDGAHTDREGVARADLEDYARAIARLVAAFDDALATP
ncbi:MAG TPA: M20/M25/M40 family metallo-hydrolase [Solirubrobacteraceae bacterium]|jgi:acetylornithine deacetylase|nr:M20/M25/M40 family metallo-hydrolase [Solirubrobacteraceae bacterium]